MKAKELSQSPFKITLMDPSNEDYKESPSPLHPEFKFNVDNVDEENLDSIEDIDRVLMEEERKNNQRMKMFLKKR